VVTEHNPHSHPSNRAFRYVRDRILTFRSDIWRANIIYAAYDLGRMMWTANSHPKTQSQIQPLDAKEGSSASANHPPIADVASPTFNLDPDREGEISPIY